MSDDPYTEPAQEWDGKTMGAAVADDIEEADALVEQEGGDEQAAEAQFESDVDDVNLTPVRAEGTPDSRSGVDDGAPGMTAERE